MSASVAFPEDSSRYTSSVQPAAIGPYLAGVVEVVPHYNVQGIHTAVNVIHWEGSSQGYTVSMLQALQTSFDNAWSQGWQPLGCPGDQYLGCTVTDKGSVTGLQVTNASYSPKSATGTGNAVPDNSSYLLSLKAATHYKGGHGRIYVPSVVTTMLNSDMNTLTTAGQNALQSLWNNTVVALSGISTLNGGPYNPVVWHKKLKQAPNTVDIVTTAIPAPRLASQRRRLRKVAHH